MTSANDPIVEYAPDGFVGVDLGIENIATASTGNAGRESRRSPISPPMRKFPFRFWTGELSAVQNCPERPPPGLIQTAFSSVLLSVVRQLPVKMCTSRRIGWPCQALDSVPQCHRWSSPS
ncbi:hypothetical protein ABZ883_33460 [Streptomyces sp. NPDC046977]|uniref:hypothetical protein n=1 Tax=Streptomyces sp. NPDC046977 TaxID=3154703 RepID=UPI0033C8D55A